MQEVILRYTRRVCAKSPSPWRRLGLYSYLVVAVFIVAIWMVSCAAHTGVKCQGGLEVYMEQGFLVVQWVVGGEDLWINDEPQGFFFQWGPMVDWSRVPFEINGGRPGPIAVFAERVLPQFRKSSFVTGDQGVALGRILRIPLWLVLVIWSAPVCLRLVRKRLSLGARWE